MAVVSSGRFTHAHDADVVVFLIGMRVNRWRAVRSWWPVFTAMPRMLRELSTDPASGLLGYRLVLGGDGPLVIQYWRSEQQLHDYAHDTGSEHRAAWRAFNSRARTAKGSVGIWHETYVVPRGQHESVYVAMPVVGLAAATAPVPAPASRARNRVAA
jgi:Domain of unknown function (DUF4188)